jgi:hypothetical protein
VVLSSRKMNRVFTIRRGFVMREGGGGKAMNGREEEVVEG